MIPFEAGKPLKASDLNFNFSESESRSFVPGNGQLGTFGGKGWIPKRPDAEPASGGASIVHFTITDFACDDIDEHGHLMATATVTFVACGLSSPKVGDEIEVVDLMGCWLTDAAPLLIGRNGIAFKVAHERAYGTGCDWSVLALCASGVVC